jgi:hypothetical protein
MEVPTMKRFLKSLYDSLESSSRPDLVHLARRILKSSSRHPDLETLIVETDGMRALDSQPITAVLLETLPKKPGGSLRKRVNEGVTATQKSVQELWTAMLEHIRTVCVSFDRDKARAVYSPLMELRKKLRLRLFTTNYDPILEDTCESLDIPFSENFVRQGNRWFFDSTYGRLRRGNLVIVKLHGSVWWYKIPELGKIERTPNLLAVSREGKPVEHLMIIPSRFKDIYGDPFFGLYLYFLRSLEDSDLCIAVGHSLRDEYLTGVLESRLRDPGFRLVVITPPPDPGDKSKNQLRTVLERRNVIHVPFKFEEFHKELTSFLETYSTDPSEAIDVLRNLIKEKKRFRQSRRAILKVQPLPESVQRGSQLTISASFKGELTKGYLVARVVQRGPRVLKFAIAPETYSEAEKTGVLDGTVLVDRSWNVEIPQDMKLGRQAIEVVAVETYSEEGEIKERDVKSKRLLITVT